MSVLARWKPVAAAVALGLAAAAASLALVDERYESEAKLQVVPLPAGDATFAGFALPRASSGASAARTVADLVERPPVVDAAAVRLRLDREEVLDAVSVSADDASNVVTVRAEAGDARRAAQLANAVADAFVAERSAVFQGDLNRAIGQLRDRLRDVPVTERDPTVVSRLAALEASLGERDPTVRIAGDAVARDDPVSISPLPVLGAALAGSLLVGLALAWTLARPRRPALPEGEELARREGELGRRVRAVTQRERALARRAGQLAERERRLRERPPEHEPEPEPERAPEPEPERGLVAPPAPPLRARTWNVVALERLVERNGPAFPGRVEEWRAYLFFLREHSSPEGELPPSFDALVEETFRELL